MFKVVEDRIIPIFLVEKFKYLNSQLNIRVHILPAENPMLVVVILRVDVWSMNVDSCLSWFISLYDVDFYSLVE